MGFWSIFSSTPKTIETVNDLAEKAASGIDKIFYTPEEKAQASQKYFDTWLDFQKTIANESTPTSISRHVLAFMIMGVFLFLILLGVILFKIDSDLSHFIFSSGVDRLQLLAEAVGATYFIKDAVVKAIQANKS